ncbi:MAG: recombinase RecX [Flavobacteriaceae bacterium]|nr:recombinase RecX [Flavobacteriaceae bacterium]|tara:strand:- start:138 stop:599 length:462 start_codon:yes stop_codon:yes gene_type:complete
MNKYLSIPELRRKGEYYCSYQERCHAEVYKKLKTYTSSNTDINEVISNLIADDFLNETRFSESFVRGKFKNKNWGKIRLILELKKRSISKKNIEIAMKQINQSIYEAKFKERFNFLIEKFKNEKKIIMKKKIFDYFNYRGWEHEIIFNEINKL